MKRFYDLVCRLEGVLARVFLAVMVCLVFGAAVARLVGHPINWAVDVATCLFAWACFFSADVAWRNNRLMSVEVLTNLLSEEVRRWLRLANYLILAVFLLYLIPAGIWLSHVSWARSFQGIPGISYSWVTLSLPVGALLLLVTTLLKARDELRTPGALA